MNNLLRALFLISMAISSACQAKQALEYVGIPSGFDFPASKERLFRDIENNNVRGMRQHAWRVFAGLTKTTNNNLPIWETWYPSSEVFSSARILPHHGLERAFVNPRQFDLLSNSLDSTPRKALLSFVLFNKEAAEHIQSNRYNLQVTLNDLNQQFDRSLTPTALRNIADFNVKSVALKLVWWFVSNDTNMPTVMPVWDGIPRTSALAFPYSDWTRCVGIDSSRTHIPKNEVRMLNCNNVIRPSRIVPLRDFYFIQVDASQLASVQQSGLPGAEDAKIGDFVILVAMHLTTKEIPNWIWASFWWHDSPDRGEFAAYRPCHLRGVWRNFLMTTSYDMTKPMEPNGQPHTAFNPWLEAKFSNGVFSNCMSCHRKAAWLEPSGAASPFPVERGAIDPGDDRFRTAVKVDFIWSVALEPVNSSIAARNPSYCLRPDAKPTQ